MVLEIGTKFKPCRSLLALYYIAYYVEGIIAIVKEWLRQDCADEVEMVADIIESCVRPKGGPAQ